MSTVTLSSKFQISIPKQVRETLNLKPGQRLAFLCVGKSVKLVPQPQIEDVLGIGKGANLDSHRAPAVHGLTPSPHLDRMQPMDSTRP